MFEKHFKNVVSFFISRLKFQEGASGTLRMTALDDTQRALVGSTARGRPASQGSTSWNREVEVFQARRQD